MNKTNSDKKRLAKNTMLLYGRTIVVMFLSLYVSRLILNLLGVTDYGVYNAVGGMVGMFSLVSGSLVAATQRYISFELGKKNGNPSYIFSLAMGLHLMIALAILVLAETVGIWFLNTYMNLPVDRIVAANFVFQFSVLTFVIQIVTTPYNAVIVAQEQMGVFAIISIMEALLKLCFALILLVYFEDKLVFYAISMTIVAVSVLLFNLIYCRYKYLECCRFKMEMRLASYKQMGAFIGWNFIGSGATVLSKQGVNVLLNIFCGVLVNAGRGIAAQVDNAVNQFINSFTTAIRPQITKTYAAQEYKDCFALINQGTKLIMYLTMMFVIPLTLRTEYILTLWLRTVPDYAVLFTRLSFLIIMMDALSTPLYYLMLATGKIRDYQIAAGSLALLVFPLTWVSLKLGMNPEVTYYILFASDVVRWVFQLCFLKRLANFDVNKYFKESILPILLVTISVVMIGVFVNSYVPETFLGLIFVIIVTTFVMSVAIMTFGLSKREKSLALKYVHTIILKQKG